MKSNLTSQVRARWQDMAVRALWASFCLSCFAPELYAASFTMTPNSSSRISLKPGASFHVNYVYNVLDNDFYDETKGVQVRIEMRKPGASSCIFKSIGHTGSGCGSRTNGFDWLIPSPYYDEYGEFDLHVIVSSNDKGGYTTGSIAYVKSTYAGAVTIQDNAAYRADMVLTPSTVNMTTPERVSFVMSIANTGTSDDSYDIVLSGAGWTFTGLPYLPSVLKGQTKTWNCSATPPSSMVEGDERNAIITLMSRAKKARVDQEEFRVAIRNTVSAGNVRANQIVGTKNVEIRYDLIGPSGAKGDVSVAAVVGGIAVPMLALSGDYGSSVAVGVNRRVVWNAGADWDDRVSSDARIRVAVDGLAPPVLSGMVLIPAGTNAGTDPELGAYSLTVSSFYMDKYEVTKALWDEVYAWAIANGYIFDYAGSGKELNHPVQKVNWYDCVKWCNARSQKEGRPAVYTVNGAIYKTSQADNVVQASVSGYRLPTSEEWQYAARGGATSHRFSWSDSDEIQHARANYKSTNSISYDSSPTRGYHPNFNDGISPYTSPVGFFAANGYGLHDMVGNVWEWCFNLNSSANFRLYLGGAWSHVAQNCKIRSSTYVGPDYAANSGGFRTVLPPDFASGPSSYVVGFEGSGESKEAYASGDLMLSGIQWKLTDALVRGDIQDRRNGVRCARMRETGAMTMLQDINNGIGTISLWYAKFGSDLESSARIEYSLDGGASWSLAGASFTATSTNLASYSTTVNKSGYARIRIVKISGNSARINIDDIMASTFGTALPAKQDPEAMDSFAYPSDTMLTGFNWGSGWGGAWYGQTSSFINYLNSFAVQPNYPEPFGNKLFVHPPDDSSRSVFRPLGATYNSGRLYIGYIMNYQYSGPYKWCGLSLFSSNTAEKLFFGEIYGQDQGLGIDNTGSAYSLTAGSGNDYIIIGCYDWKAGQARVKAYNIGVQTVPNVEPISWDVTIPKASNLVGSINTIRLAAGADSGRPGNCFFDEVRIATNWAGLIGLNSGTNSVLNKIGLVAYYPFNGNADDESGKGNHGVVRGASLVADRHGNQARAFAFNGTNDIMIADSSSLDLLSTLTIAAWICPTNMLPEGTVQNRSIVSKPRDASGTGYTLCLNRGPHACVGLHNGENALSPTSTNSLASNSWVHVVGSFSGTNAIVYVNGVLQGGATGSAFSLLNSTQPLYIGTEGITGWGDRSFRGMVDEVRIYNRILSAAEIQQLYLSE